jgi:hypothetical protein
VGMWESRRDFQRVWEGWEAGFMAFHPSHTLSLPRPAYRWIDRNASNRHARVLQEPLIVLGFNE